MVLVDLKGIKRVLEKAIHDYSEDGDEEGGLRKVLDIVQASIMCDTPKEIKNVSKMDLQLHYVRNGFISKWHLNHER